MSGANAAGDWYRYEWNGCGYVERRSQVGSDFGDSAGYDRSQKNAQGVDGVEDAERRSSLTTAGLLGDRDAERREQQPESESEYQHGRINGGCAPAQDGESQAAHSKKAEPAGNGERARPAVHDSVDRTCHHRRRDQ